MTELKLISFNEYIKDKGINIVEDIEWNKNRVTKELFKRHLYTLKEFHSRSKGYDMYIISKLCNDTGKLLESYKIYNKRLKKDLDRIRANEPSNTFEELLISIGDRYLKRAEVCVEHMLDCDYFELIKRSMDNVEICLVNTDFNNIVLNSNSLEVVDITNCSYDMVEIDCIRVMNKLKKSNININYNEVIKYFCHVEELGENSERFISAAVSYPFEFIRCCNRYREKSRKWTNDRFKKRLIKAVEQDINILI